MKLDLRVLAAIGVTLVLWGSAFSGVRAGLAAYGPEHLALLRFLVASVVLAGYALLKRLPLPRREDIPAIALLGLLGITVYHLALNRGEVTVPAGTTSLIINTTPIFTALLSAVMLKERLVLRSWVGIGLSFAGIVLITLGEGKVLELAAGAVFLLVASFAFSLDMVLQKRYLAKYSAVAFTAYMVWAGTFFLLIFLPGLPEAVQRAPLSATLAVVYLGVFPAALAYVLWAYILARGGVSQTANLLYLVPILSLFIAWVWLKEAPSGLTLLGGGLTLGGVALLNGALGKVYEGWLRLRKMGLLGKVVPLSK
ncbi:DMT family transporter [Anthocerotibacter panamensis]|uniref:DMT family transporter n=1 Tax=Anthocerotibacter panamensis TaxID=2857077 RepID=UPI001C4074A7|nr:EamA family transporter [Anthocerotibacter panamensis]